MRRSIRIPLVLTGLLLVGVLAPAAVAARSPDRDIVTFISREELIAAGLISPAADPGAVTTGGRTTVAQPQALCVWDCIYVKNRRYLRTVKPFVTMVQGNGPTTIAIDISRTVRNSFSATVSVSAEVVTAGIGFNVEWAETVAYKSSTSVPSGACWTIRAYNVFYEYGFEIWQEPFIGSDKKIGTGTARNFQGIEFRLSKWC
ncbi:MAG TPA: hypothetical protein VHK05_08265 [Candidatus Limnocylindrales bacterium]|jgi:hypothetical protein|nr:hypothetical protein [Candidatus Limnocylindrales bacterium]